jgi:type IV secretion system protein VirD4
LSYPVGERLLVAPMGAGKGTSFVIPTLLTYPASTIINDTKAELAAVTSRYRVTFGGTAPKRIVYLLDPYRLTDQPGFKDPRLALAGFIRHARFNPFDSVDVENSLNVMRDLDFAVEAIVDRTAAKKSGAEEHFEQGTINVIRGVAFAGLTYRARGQSRDRGEDTPISPRWVYMTLRDVMENPLDAVPWLRRAGGPAKAAATILAAAGDRERGSYITTALRMLSWLEDDAMGDIVADTTINIDLIFKGHADIFMILPPNLVDAKGRWIVGLLKAFFSLHESSAAERLPRKGMEVLYMIDEAGPLGAARPIQESWTRLRGYGGRICAIFQTRGQQERYEMPSVFETADVVEIFGTHDSATIKWFTEVCGRTIIERISLNEGQQGNSIGGQRSGLSGGRQISQTDVDYVTPEVIRELGSTEGIALVKGIGTPVLFDQVPYYLDPLLAGRYDDNPLERKTAA